MQFKNVWIKGQLPKVDERIRTILNFLDFYMQARHGLELCVTELIRTQEEQYHIYGANYPKKSVHQYGRGADVRCYNWTQAAIDDALFLLNSIPYGKGTYKTAIYHQVGDNGIHIHIQVKY